MKIVVMLCKGKRDLNTYFVRGYFNQLCGSQFLILKSINHGTLWIRPMIGRATQFTDLLEKSKLTNSFDKLYKKLLKCKASL